MLPSDFALYKLVINNSTLMQSLFQFGIPVTLSYCLVHGIGRHGRVINAGITAAIISTVISSVVCLILLLIQHISKHTWIDSEALYLSFLCIIPFLATENEYACIGLNRIKLLSYQKFMGQLLLLLALLAGFFITKSISLPFSISAYGITNIAVIIFLLHRISSKITIRATDIKRLFKLNRRYGRQTYLGSLVSVASARAVVVIVSAFVSKNDYALYALAVSVALPMGPFISMVGSVMFKKYSKLDKMSRRYIAMISVLTAASVLCYWVLSAIFIPVAFGKFYGGSIVFAQIMGTGALLQGLGDVFNRFIMVKGRMDYIRNGAIITGSANMILAIVLIPIFTTTGASVTTLASGGIYLFAMVVYYIKVVRVNDGKDIRRK
jgi:O-antigen/teichoic acid export membrane protein